MLDAKLRRFARELEELRTCSDTEYSNHQKRNGKVAPARPPPPKMKVSQMTPRTPDMLPDQRLLHTTGHLLDGQMGICQHRTRRATDGPQAPPPPSLPEPLSMRNKGKFASIRKFFKLENRDSSAPRFGSVRRQLPFSRPKLDISAGKYASVRGGSQERPCSLMFHSMHEDCFLDDEIAGFNGDDNSGSVKITEFAEISTSFPRMQKPARPFSEIRLGALAVTTRSSASATDLRETNVDGDRKFTTIQLASAIAFTRLKRLASKIHPFSIDFQRSVRRSPS